MQKAESKIHSPVEEDLYRKFGQALFIVPSLNASESL